MSASPHGAAGGPPVMVVGAGPTGLAAAIDLARLGVPCRLIDRLPAPPGHSRAIAIQARTLELLEQRGCVEPMLRLGHRGRFGNVHSEGRQLARIDFGPLASRYHFLLFLDQSETDRILTERLAALGVEVERGVELTGFEDRGDAVDLALRHADGREEEARTPFLLGCDGAHSFVRHRLGLAFEGRTLPQSFALADLHVGWDRSEDEFDVFASGDGLAAIFPMGRGRHRLVATLAGEPAGEAPTLAECQAIVDRRIGPPPRLSALSWSSYFHVNSRRVERLRAGRIFVAGDAAHIHSPAAGQGMNTGIQEAFNLAWKVALVVRGEAGQRLLDTYDAERRPIERHILAGTELATRIVSARRGLVRALRDRLTAPIVAAGPVQDFARRIVSELAVNYCGGALAHERTIEGGPRAGERAPDAWVNVVAGPEPRRGRCRIFELLGRPGFALLLLVDPSVPGATLEADRAATLIAEAMAAPVSVWRLRENADQEQPGLLEGYGDVRTALYLVRPDGYVLARGHLSEAASIAAFCRSWFHRP